jgi:hypothetical protein
VRQCHKEERESSIRFDSIRFDSIRFDRVTFVSRTNYDLHWPRLISDLKRRLKWEKKNISNVNVAISRAHVYRTSTSKSIKRPLTSLFGLDDQFLRTCMI